MRTYKIVDSIEDQMRDVVTEAMLQAAYHVTDCPVGEHGPGPRNRDLFTQIYLAMRAASAIEASGQDGETRLDAKHKSATGNAGTPK